MSLGSDSNKTVTTTSTLKDPYSNAKPVVDSALSKANDLLSQNIGGEHYDQSLVVPYADETLQGMQGTMDVADQYGTDLQQPFLQSMDVINSGGYNGYQQGAVDRMNAFASGNGFNTQTAGAASSMQNLNSQFQGTGGLTSYQGDAISRASDLAAGNEVLGTNPGFQRMLQESNQAAQHGVNTEAAKLGRYGSGTHQENVAEALANNTANLYGQEYNQQLQRQDAARDQMFGMSQQGVGNVQSTAQGLAQIGQTGYDNATNANRDLFESGQVGLGNVQTAAGQLPTAYDAIKKPYQDYMTVGSMQEDLQTRQMQDDLRRFKEEQNSAWLPVERAMAVGTGAGSLGGNSTETLAVPSTSAASQMIGGALNGYDNQNMFGGGWGGAASGAVQGLLGGIFG